MRVQYTLLHTSVRDLSNAYPASTIYTFNNSNRIRTASLYTTMRAHNHTLPHTRRPVTDTRPRGTVEQVDHSTNSLLLNLNPAQLPFQNSSPCCGPAPSSLHSITLELTLKVSAACKTGQLNPSFIYAISCFRFSSTLYISPIPL